MLKSCSGTKARFGVRPHQYGGNVPAAVGEVCVHRLIPGDYQKAVAEVGAVDYRINIGHQPVVDPGEDLGVGTGGQSSRTIMPIVLGIWQDVDKVRCGAGSQVG